MEGGNPGKEPPKAAGGDDPAKQPDKPLSAQERRRRMRWGIVAFAVAVAVIAWVATRDNSGDSSSEPAPPPPPPRIVTSAELVEAEEEIGQPIYWAGQMEGDEMVLEQLAEGGGVQILYVPEGTAAGEASAGSLTIGSYPVEDPAAALEANAEAPGQITREGPEGRTLVTSEEGPTSVYFASSDNSVEVEVYDPSPQKAMSLALSGKVQPAG